MHEKTLTSKTIFTGKLIRVETQVVELDNGLRADREFVRHAAAVAVLVRAKDGRLVLVRQFRKCLEKMMLEVIAGILDHADEPPEAAARRELREETGYEAVTMKRLGRIYPTPGYVDEVIDVYYAEVAAEAGPQDMDIDERIEVVTMTEADFKRDMRNGLIEDAKTLAAWALYQASLG